MSLDNIAEEAAIAILGLNGGVAFTDHDFQIIRSAIDKALRVVMEKEPSHFMLMMGQAAGIRAAGHYVPPVAKSIYRAMADQLLKELCGE